MRLERPTVAVLDTNVAKGTGIAVLRALQACGWRLRLSAVALFELLAHFPEQASETIPRLAKLAEVLDPEERIAPTHSALLDKIGGGIDGGSVVGHYRTWKAAQGTTLDKWTRQTTLADLDEATIASLKALVSDSESDFVDTMTRMREGPPSEEARVLLEAGVTDLATMARRMTPSLYLPIHVAGGVQERYHLHYSLLGLHGARGALSQHFKQKGVEFRLDPNSTHDGNIAQHLAEGVFVVTDDLRFIVNDVDETGSFQAPWVRTPWELLTTELPGGLPWGRTAKRARDRHVRRTVAHLKEIERACRLALGLP